MVLRIQRDSQTRADVVTELLKHLRYRYELSERVLVHHAKLAADAMIGKALSIWRDALWIDRAFELLDRETPATPLRTRPSEVALEARLGKDRVS